VNCPNCGAENDAEARFCAECGAPLENQDIEATVIGQNLRDIVDSDQTIMAGPAEIEAEEAATVAVDQAALAAAVAEERDSSAPEPETPPASPSGPSSIPAGTGSGGGDGGFGPGSGDQNRKMWIIIGVVVLVLLLCCCCALIIGALAGSGDFEKIIKDLSSLSINLPLV